MNIVQLARSGVLVIERQQVSLKRKFDEIVAASVCEAICFLSVYGDLSLPITLLIDSEGGNVDAAEIIVEGIQKSRMAVECLVMGKAYSAVFCVVQECSKRLASEAATFLFHPPWRSAAEASRLTGFPHLDNVVNEKHPSYIKLLNTLSRRSGQTLERLKVWGLEEKKFTAREALELGFIDEILRDRVRVPIGIKP